MELNGAASSWEYNCPQFVDFSVPLHLHEDQNAEDYFNFDHENGEQPLVLDDFNDLAEGTDSPQPRVTRQSHRNSNTIRNVSMETSIYEDAPCQTPAPRQPATPGSARRVRSASKTKTPSSAQRVPTEGKLRSPGSAQRVPVSTKTTPGSARRVQRKASMTPKHTPRRSSRLASSPAVVTETEPAVVPANDKTSEPTDTGDKEPESERTVAVAKVAPVERVPPNLFSSLEAWRNKGSSKTNDETSKAQTKVKRKSPRQRKAALKEAKKLKPITQIKNQDTGSSPAMKKQRHSISTPMADRRKPDMPGKAPASGHTKAHTTRSQTQSLDYTKTTGLSLPRKNSVGKPASRPGSLERGRPERLSARNRSSSRLSADQGSRSPQRKETKGPAMKPKLTIPSTPTFMKRKPISSQALTKAVSSGSVKSSEELEMDKIRELRQELARKRKMAAESLQKSQASKGYVAKHAALPVTKPEPIHFATDERIKSHTMETRKDQKSKDFVSGLRYHPASPGKPGHRVTVPQPFHLHDRKRKRQEEESALTSDRFESVAQKIIAFSSKTPDRFRSKPSSKEPSPCKRRRNNSSNLTVPKTPNFETKGRKRPVTVLSQADIEAQELEEIKKFKFKANPVNDKIMKNPNTGLKKVPTKEPTQPVGFSLETEHRKETWDSKKKDETDHFEFHAKPVPKGILKGPVGLRPQKDIPLTVPESPAFALKNRLRSRVQEPEQKEEEEEKVFLKPRPVPHTGVPFQPKIEHRITEPQPFSFEERTRQMFKKKEQMIQKVFEDEKKAREFRAQPLRDLSSPEGLPSRKVKESTQPEPFLLEVDIRGAQKAEEWSQKVEEELRQQRAQASAFKAKPNKVTVNEPFMPRKSTKPLTDISDFELNTERRAEKRTEWEHMKYEQEREVQAMRQARERERQEEERREMDRLRREAVHKANPIKRYKAVEVHPSDKPLTEPHTPRFSERLRSRSVRM